MLMLIFMNNYSNIYCVHVVPFEADVMLVSSSQNNTPFDHLICELGCGTAQSVGKGFGSGGSAGLELSTQVIILLFGSG